LMMLAIATKSLSKGDHHIYLNRAIKLLVKTNWSSSRRFKLW